MVVTVASPRTTLSIYNVSKRSFKMSPLAASFVFIAHVATISPPDPNFSLGLPTGGRT